MKSFCTFLGKNDPRRELFYFEERSKIVLRVKKTKQELYLDSRIQIKAIKISTLDLTKYMIKQCEMFTAVFLKFI